MAKYTVIAETGEVRETNDKDEFTMLIDLLEEEGRGFETEVDN